MSARASRKPVFFWQGLLILLPVGLMAGIGMTAIVRDKAAVEQQARERAQEIAGQLAPELGRRLAAELAAFDLSGAASVESQRLRLDPGRSRSAREPAISRTNDAGPNGATLTNWVFPDLGPEEMFPDRVLLPADGGPDQAAEYDPPPRPPEWFLGLTQEQRQSYDALRRAQLPGTKAGGLGAALKAFLALDLGVEARANAQLVQLELEPGREPVRALRAFAQEHRGMRSEAGLPLSNLALAEALRQAGSGPELGSVLDALVDESLAGRSLLLPELLARARALAAKAPQGAELLDAAERLWSAQARLGRMAWRVRQQGRRQGPTNLWVEAEGRRWLCVLHPDRGTPPSGGSAGGSPPSDKTLPGRGTPPSGGSELRVYPKAVIERAFVRAIRASGVAVPGYFGLTAELEGEPLGLSGSRATQAGAARVFAEAQDQLDPPGGPRWVLRLRLADPARLFAQQRQRTLLFGGLIAASALAAICGLAAARSAFYRQLRLGELKSNFVSSVSHELRSPIASVRLLAEGLESGKVADPAKQRQYFRFIGQECRRLSSLIENVLDFARIEQGRKQYEFEPTDLEGLAQETLKLMEIPAAEREVKLALAIPESALQALRTEVVVDGKALQQALVNLIDNAMKHSPKGQTVTVGLEARGPEEERQGGGSKLEGRGAAARAPRAGPQASSGRTGSLGIALWVEDHGDGIPAEEQERIFERFYRRGPELRRQTQGVGIGLSIVKHIAEAHGGRVLVRSAPGQGSRFTIELPGWKSAVWKGC